MVVERTCLDKKREFPAWLAKRLAEDRAGLDAIPDPYKRRLAELDIDEIETRVKVALLGAR